MGFPEIRMKVNTEIQVDGTLILTHNTVTQDFINYLSSLLVNGGTVTPVTGLVAILYYQGTPVATIPLNVIFVSEKGNSLTLIATGSDNSSSQYSFDTVDIVAFNQSTLLYTISTISASGSKNGSFLIEWTFSDTVLSGTPATIAGDVEQICGKWCQQNRELCLNATGGGTYENALSVCENQLDPSPAVNESPLQYLVNLLVIPQNAYPQNTPFYDLYSSLANPYSIQGLLYFNVTNPAFPLNVVQLSPGKATIVTARYTYGIAFIGINTIPYALVDTFNLTLPQNAYFYPSVKLVVTQ